MISLPGLIYAPLSGLALQRQLLLTPVVLTNLEICLRINQAPVLLMPFPAAVRQRVLHLLPDLARDILIQIPEHFVHHLVHVLIARENSAREFFLKMRLLLLILRAQLLLGLFFVLANVVLIVVLKIQVVEPGGLVGHEAWG